MELNVSVKYKNGHFVGTIPGSGVSVPRGIRGTDYKKEIFRRYYEEACDLEISEKDLLEYIGVRIMNEEDITNWFDDEELAFYYKREKLNLHRRVQRFRQKVYWLNPNYYVTFTYSDAKETRESFEKRLKTTLSNFATRHGWKGAVVPEDGKTKGRLHFHCFLHIPEGAMIGELFLNAKYNTKKRRRDFFTDNTYFNARFGQSDWHPITREDLYSGGLESYLTKYLMKSGNKIFYSRGIPTEIFMVIDTETDVLCTFRENAWKVLLFDSVMDVGLGADPEEELPILDELPGFDIFEHYLKFTDKRKLVWNDEAA